MARWLEGAEELVELLDLVDQKFLRSVGEGYQACISIMEFVFRGSRRIQEGKHHCH